MGASKIRLLIADDHEMMREGLKSLIEKESDISIEGETNNGKEVVTLAAKLKPDVVVMDVAMPDLNGIEATRKIIAKNPNTKIVGLSAHPDQHFVREMLKAGASGYVLKHTAYEDLLRAIREAMKGKTYLSSEITRGVVDTYVRSRPRPSENPAFAILTDREREVLQSISEGSTTKEIAYDMNVSIKTIETHRRNIMQKLDIHSVAELTKYAIREGITSMDV